MNTFILKKPIITERSTQQTKIGFYTFEVPELANKNVIKRAVKMQFNVDVISIKTIRMHGKSKRISRTGLLIPARSWKKAIVKIKKDQKIPLFNISS